MTPIQDRILRDLTRDLHNRVMTCQRDFVSRCEAMDIPLAEILSSLCVEFSFIYVHQAVTLLNMTPAQFARLCMDQFKKVQEDESRRSQAGGD